MWAWLAIPWVRKLAGAALALAAIAGIAFAIYHAGIHAGAREEAGKETEAARPQFDRLEKTYQAALAASEAREERLGIMAAKFADVAVAAANRVEIARAASAVDAAKVKAIPDSAVKSDLISKAGGPLDDVAVLRRIDEMVTDYPHKVEEVTAQREQLAAINARIDAVLAQLETVRDERNSAMAAFNQLVPLYTQAYNAAIVGRRKWYCLFLCKPKNRMQLPDPVTLGGKGAK